MILLDGSLLGLVLSVVLAGIYEGLALAGVGGMPTISSIVQAWDKKYSFIAALTFWVILSALAALFGHFMRWF